MHDVLVQLLYAYRLKCSGAHVQRNECMAYAVLVQFLEQGQVEVQARRGGGDSAGFAGVDGLVAFVVLGAGRVRNLRRKGSEEGGVGNECVCTDRSRWSTYHYKKKR